MNIDEKIKQELESEAVKIDQIVSQQEGIFTMLLNTYKGALGGWMIAVTVITLLVTAAMIWSGYQFFFQAVGVEEKLHWAMILGITIVMQISLKMWTFMEMNRNSIIREMKRLEIAITRLSDK
ncbi:MAG: DUF6768 family protein [Thalassotalea sp.]